MRTGRDAGRRGPLSGICSLFELRGLIQSRNWVVESDLVTVLALGEDRHLVQVVGEPRGGLRNIDEVILGSRATRRPSSLILASAQPGDPDRLDLGLIAMSETERSFIPLRYSRRKDA